MTQFNPEKKKLLSYEEACAPAMCIKDKDDAQQYFKDYVAYITRALINDTPGGKTPEEIAKINLGYYAGYYSIETRLRVEELFDCVHPYLGSVKEKANWQTDELLALGEKIAHV